MASNTAIASAPPAAQPDGVDPIILQIVEESLNSIEREVEAAIERTSRSPMIRDQHDYRVGIHDRRCRKLTGRSYSAMVDPVVRDFPIATMQPGDVYFFNDVYLSEGSIGHLPDLCTTVPVFHNGDVVAFVQAFGHHDDIGGAVPGSMPGTAQTCFQEGLMIPPIKLVEAGVRNEGAYRIIVRNTRLPDSVAADIDSEIAACRMGAERIAALFHRFGRATMERCFQAILDRCRDNFLREIFPKIRNGTYSWEDYVEHDGVSEPRLHALRLTMTKSDDKIVLDFRGTDPQSPGPINWPADYADGRFLIKWAAPVLRSLADSPERAAELHVNEGICDIFEVIFPDKGSLISPEFPAATNARSFVLLRTMGLLAGAVAHAVDEGRMPADQETIRYWGLHGHDREGRFFLWREVLGGGSGGRSYADGSDVIHIVPDSRNQPAEFAETRFPIVIERLGLRRDSGGVGERRGGLGYEKDVRLLVDAKLILTADRVHLGCYGVNGGAAGQPYQTFISPAGEPARDGRSLPGLLDGEPLTAGQLVRIVTTGGGGWGDPLDREPEMVRMDVVRGLVSAESAQTDYGVVLGPAPTATDSADNSDSAGAAVIPALVVDEAATAARRDELRAARTAPLPLIDRGPGYAELLRRTQLAENKRDDKTSDDERGGQ